MASVNNAPGEQLLLLVGNGATPEVFTALCTINTTRSLDLTVKASATEIADCTTPSNPAYMVRQAQSIDLKFTGNGIADAPSVATTLIPWWQNGSVKNCKLQQNRSSVNGGFTITAPLIMTSLQLQGARGDQQTFTGSFELAGAIVSISYP